MDFTTATAPAATVACEIEIHRAGVTHLDFSYIRANFDNIADASSVGVVGDKQMAMSAGTMNASMARLAKKSRFYAAESAPIAFDQEDRAVAKEANVKNKS
jgi:hypothetical protein